MKCTIGCVVWAITAVASIHWGLLALGFNIFAMVLGTNSAYVEMFVHYAAGIAGVASMAMLVQKMMSGCDSCGCK